jgi:hypothetical protein
MGGPITYMRKPLRRKIEALVGGKMRNQEQKKSPNKISITFTGYRRCSGQLGDIASQQHK